MTQTLRGVAVLGAATVLQAIRSRLLWVSVVFAVVMVGLSMSAAGVALYEQARIIVDTGLAAASGLGTAVALAATVSFFSSELKNRTAYVILARPIPRAAYIVGKFLGLWAAMILVVVAMGLATAAVVWTFDDTVPAAFWASLTLTVLEMAVAIAVAQLFCTLSVPALAATYAAGVLLAGNMSSDIAALAHRMEARAGGPTLASQLMRGVFYLLPDLDKLSLRPQAANRLPVPDGYVLQGGLYALAYTALMLTLSSAIFSRRKAL